MLAYAVLLLAALSRFFPFMMHQHVGLNLTAVGAGLLFFGSQRSRYEAAAAAAIMGFSDFLLTKYVYGFPFAPQHYLVTWAWYAAVVLLASQLLRKVTPLRVAAGVVASATGFFVLSNFAVWVGSRFYPHTLAGLGECYALALPFYRNDLVSTGLFAAVLFALPVLAARLNESMRHSGATLSH